jgi:hypothetical protein
MRKILWITCGILVAYILGFGPCMYLYCNTPLRQIGNFKLWRPHVVLARHYKPYFSYMAWCMDMDGDALSWVVFIEKSYDKDSIN